MRIISSLVFTLVTSSWLVVGCGPRSAGHSLVPARGVPASVGQDSIVAASQNFGRLYGQMPSLERANLGPHIKSVVFKTPWNVRDAFAADDGTLYVIVAPIQWGLSRYYFGTLHKGNFRFFRLPSISSEPNPEPTETIEGGYQSMEFIRGTRANTAVVGAVLADAGKSYVFTARGGRLRAVRAAGEAANFGGYEPDFLLSTGEECTQPEDRSSAIAVFAKSKSGHTRPLIALSEIKAATGGILTNMYEISVVCHHFAGQDFVELSSGEPVIFRLAGKRLIPISRGMIYATGRSRMLVRQSSDETSPTYVILLEAFTSYNGAQRHAIRGE